MPVIDPNLSAQRWNRLIVEAYDEYRKLVFEGVRNLFQSRYFVGQTPPANKMEEMMGLMAQMPQLVTVLQQSQDEGERVRAQAGLRRLEELRRDFMTGANGSEQSQALA